MSRVSRDGVYGALDKFSTWTLRRRTWYESRQRSWGGNLRYVLSNIEYDEVSAVLAFLTRHLDFVGGGEEGDEDDSEGSPPRNRTRERRLPDPSTTPGKRRKVKSPEEDL